MNTMRLTMEAKYNETGCNPDTVDKHENTVGSTDSLNVCIVIFDCLFKTKYLHLSVKF